MTEQQIYVLMAKTPDIRAVQIADVLDQEVDDVVTALGPLVRVGNVVQKGGFSPNGFPVQQYNLTEQFKKSAEYEAVMAIVAAQKAATAPTTAAKPAPPAAAGVTIKTVTIAPLPVQETQTTRADRGVAYVTKMQRPVSQQEMRNAMGLNKSQYPAAVLVAAIRDGKLHKDGSMWKSGPAPSDQVDQPATDAPKPEAPVDRAPSAQPAVPATPLAATVFRCGLWSDGVLELQRNGDTVAVLKQDEGEQLASFVNRMLLDPMGSAVQTSTQR